MAVHCPWPIRPGSSRVLGGGQRLDYHAPTFGSSGPLLHPMDIVYLRDLRIDTVIGIFDWERRTTQTVILDLEMSADIARAAASDDIKDTLNYKAVAKRLIQFVGDSDFQLVETLAERCAQIIRQEFDVRWVKLTLNKKGAVRGADDVGVMIERGERF